MLNATDVFPQVLVVAAALAQVCAKSQQFPTFSGSQDKKTSEAGERFLLGHIWAMKRLQMVFSVLRGV